MIQNPPKVTTFFSHWHRRSHVALPLRFSTQKTDDFFGYHAAD